MSSVEASRAAHLSEDGADPRLTTFFQSLSGAMAALVIGLGAMGLIGWVAGLPLLRSGLPGGRAAMERDTAIALVAAGAAVVCSVRGYSGTARLLAAATLAIGVAGAASHLFGTTSGSGLQVLSGGREAASAGRAMPVMTALCLALSGGAILLIEREKLLSEIAASLVAVVSLTAVIAYLDGATSPFSLAPYGSMALSTAIALKLLQIAVLFSSPRLRVMQLMVSKGASGTVARIMLPAAIFLPATINWLRLQGERAGWFDAQLGVAAGTALVIVVWEFLICSVAEHIRRADAARQSSERKLREMEVLREKDEHFRLMVEGFPEYGVFMLDPEGRIITWNGGARRIAGYESADVLGTNYAQFFLAEDVAQGLPAQLLEATRREGRCAYQGWRKRKDGERFWIDSEIVAVWEPEGALRGFAIISRDATAQHEAEARLVAANRHKTEFLANMSHELRTPLNAIVGFSSFLHSGKAGPLTEEQREYLGDVLSSSRQLLHLVNDVLDMARVEAGRFEFDNQEVDLMALITEVCESLRGLAGEKHLRIETTVEGESTATLDPVKFKQVLYNFLSNAIKFTPDKRQIAVRLRPEDGAKFRLEVEDTGIGIKPEDLERLFKEFEQLDGGTAKNYQGTGLGLALTKRLIEAQGGNVVVSSVLGQGSVFGAVLPRRVTAESFSDNRYGLY